MSLTTSILLILGLGVIAWFMGRAKATHFATTEGAASARPHSLPGYHGWFVAVAAILPALLFAAIWAGVTPSLVTQRVASSETAQSLPSEPMERAAILGEARGLATGQLQTAFNPQAETLAPVFRDAQRSFSLIGLALALSLTLACGSFAYTRLQPDFRARTSVERAVTITLLFASLIAILTTIGIVASLLFESIRFFGKVGVFDFLFGTRWRDRKSVV